LTKAKNCAVSLNAVKDGERVKIREDTFLRSNMHSEVAQPRRGQESISWRRGKEAQETRVAEGTPVKRITNIQNKQDLIRAAPKGAGTGSKNLRKKIWERPESRSGQRQGLREKTKKKRR